MFPKVLYFKLNFLTVFMNYIVERGEYDKDVDFERCTN